MRAAVSLLQGLLLCALCTATVTVGASRAEAQADAQPEASPPATPAPQPEAPAPTPQAEVTPPPLAPAAPTSPGLATPAPSASPERRRDSKACWTGPRVELAYRIYSLTDDAGGGAVNSFAFSGFLPTRFVRAGGGLEAGARGYEYGPTEGLFSGNVFAGYQHLRDLGRFVPYAVAVGELGFVLSKRFHTPRTNMLRGIGVEIGADVNVVRSFYVGLGLGYMKYSLDGLAYDSFGLRLSLGL